jgi:outer membrane protein assembly factor BamB
MVASAVVFLALAAQGEEAPDLRTRKTGVDWPGFLGPNRDGKSPERGPLAPWPPRVVWQRELGESFGAASVARGRLFHFDRFGSKVRLTCMRSETGEELWKTEYETDYVDQYSDNSGPRSCPVVDGDRVYVFGVEGLLQCFRVADGSLLWKKDTTRDFAVVRNFFGAGSTPVVEGDLLIAQVGGTAPSGIVAFDKRTGEVKYRITDERASYASPVTATIGGRRWGFAFARGGLVGFEPGTGRVDFQFPWRARMTNSVNAASPVVVGDRVFITETYMAGGALLKVRPGGFDELWSGRSLMSWWNTPIHVDGFLYGPSGMEGAELRCVELATGKVRWSAGGPGQSSLLWVDGHFVALGVDGELRLVKVNPERYEETAKAELKAADGGALLKSPARAAPVLSHGLLYVRGKDRLACLDLIPVK